MNIIELRKAWPTPIAAIALLVGSPLSAQAEQPTEPDAYLEKAISLLEQHHMNRDRIDWAEVRSAAAALTRHAETPSDTYAAIRAVVVAMGDNHGFLMLPRQTIQKSGGTTAAQQEPPMPTGRAVDGEIGYVSLPYLTTSGGLDAVGDRYREVLRTTLKGLDAQAGCGWIIDLRQNLGGNMWPMLNGLDPLLGEGPFGYFIGFGETNKWVRTAAGITSVPADATGNYPASFDLANADAPLAILLGPRTGSSGEMVAIALEGRDKARTFGTPTANFTTAVSSFDLDDGAILGVTSSKVGLRTGEVVDGPLQPHQPVEGDAMEPAREWLAAQCAVPFAE